MLLRFVLASRLQLIKEIGITRSILSRLIEDAIIHMRSPKVHNVIDYKDYLNPYIYTSHDSYLDQFISLGIGKKLNMSFNEFMGMEMQDVNAIIRKCKGEMSNVGESDLYGSR